MTQSKNDIIYVIDERTKYEILQEMQRNSENI